MVTVCDFVIARGYSHESKCRKLASHFLRSEWAEGDGLDFCDEHMPEIRKAIQALASLKWGSAGDGPVIEEMVVSKRSGQVE